MKFSRILLNCSLDLQSQFRKDNSEASSIVGLEKNHQFFTLLLLLKNGLYTMGDKVREMLSSDISEYAFLPFQKRVVLP